MSKRKTYECTEDGSPCEQCECQECCDHSDIPECGTCIDCGKVLYE